MYLATNTITIWRHEPQTIRGLLSTPILNVTEHKSADGALVNSLLVAAKNDRDYQCICCT